MPDRPQDWKRTSRTTALVLCWAASLMLPLASAASDPDPSFGSNGRVLVAQAGTDIRIGALALQANGEVLVAMTRLNTSGGTWQRSLAVRRLREDGSFDPAYGIGGEARFDMVTPQSLQARQILPLADGRLLVLATLNVDSYYARLVLARFTASGAPDLSFSLDGMELYTDTDFSCEVFLGNGCRALLQADGSLWIAGSTRSAQGHNTGAAIARITASGELDPQFGSAGLLRFPNVPGSQSQAYTFTGLARAPDGRVLASAVSRLNDGSVAGTYVCGGARLLANGSLDASYGTQGWTELPIGANGVCVPTAMQLEPSGRLLMGGYRRAPPTFSYFFGAGRLRADGLPDAGFGSNGQIQIGFNGVNSNSLAGALAVAGEGSFYLVGNERSGALGQEISRAGVMRLQQNGQLDLGFGSAGRRLYDASDSASADVLALSALIDAQGRLLIAGTRLPSENVGPFDDRGWLLRLRGDAVFRDGFEGG